MEILVQAPIENDFDPIQRPTSPTQHRSAPSSILTVLSSSAAVADPGVLVRSLVEMVPSASDESAPGPVRDKLRGTCGFT